MNPVPTLLVRYIYTPLSLVIHLSNLRFESSYFFLSSSFLNKIFKNVYNVIYVNTTQNWGWHSKHAVMRRAYLL